MVARMRIADWTGGFFDAMEADRGGFRWIDNGSSKRSISWFS